MSKVILKQKIEKLVNHFHAGRYSFVIRESKLLLKKLPENPFLYNLIASCHQYLNDLEAAKKIFIYVLQLDPKNISAYNNLGNVYKNLKKFKMAEENYERALKINPLFKSIAAPCLA